MNADVWPDNVNTVNAFVAMATQWRVGFHGPYGLDYSALPQVLRLVRIPRAEWSEVFDGLRVMEDAALAEIRSRDNK